MNARQSVLIAMFLSVAVYLLANAQATAITAKISTLKQVPVPAPGIVPIVPVSPGGGFGGGSSGGTPLNPQRGGAGGGF